MEIEFLVSDFHCQFNAKAFFTIGYIYTKTSSNLNKKKRGKDLKCHFDNWKRKKDWKFNIFYIVFYQLKTEIPCSISSFETLIKFLNQVLHIKKSLFDYWSDWQPCLKKGNGKRSQIFPFLFNISIEVQHGKHFTRESFCLRPTKTLQIFHTSLMWQSSVLVTGFELNN